MTPTTRDAHSLLAGRYELRDTLGRGGMGSVERAHDVELDRDVAIKRLAATFADDIAFRDRFVREARLAGRLSHPNITRVYDLGKDDDDRPFIVMELVDGESLAHRLRRAGPLPAIEAIALIRQACAGLAHAHRAGLVHRDVKPSNLLLERSGGLKVADFGIARAAEMSQITVTGVVLGSRAYLPPEQATGFAVGPPADLFSLGLVLVDAICGLAKNGDPQRPHSLNELRPVAGDDVVDLLRRMVDVEPDRRPESAGEVADLLLAAEVPGSAPLAVELPHLAHEAARRAENGTARTAGDATTALDEDGTDVAAGNGDAATPGTRVEPAARRLAFDDTVVAAAAARRGTRRRRTRFVAAVAAALLAVGAAATAIALSADESPAPAPAPAQPEAVTPPPRDADPGERARNVSRWIRGNTN